MVTKSARRLVQVLAEQFRIAGIDRSSLPCLVACTAAFSAWTSAVTGHLAPMTLVWLAALPLTLYLYGDWVTRAVGLDSSIPFALATGSIVYALLVLALRTCCPVSLKAATLLVMGGSVVVGWSGRFARRPQRARPGELFVVLFCLVAATLWSQDVLFGAIREQADGFVYHSWVDYFTHAKFAAMLRNSQPLLQADNYELSGHPAMFYHYASYVYPASLAEVSNRPAYEGLLALWTPLGTALVGLAAYGMVGSWWGARSGLLGVLCLYGLPDASAYGFHSGYFGFWWLQQAAPAGNYGVVCGAVALTLVVRGAEELRGRLVASGLAFAGCCLFFKAQVFVVLVPLCGLTLIFCLPRISLACRLVLTLVLAILGAGAVFLASGLRLFPPWCWDGQLSTEWFRWFIVPCVPNPDHRALFDVFLKGETTYQHPVRAGLLLLGLAFGLLPAAYCLLLVWAACRRTLEGKCLVPVAATLLYALMVFGLGKNEGFGYPDELRHRPFVWVYFLWVVCTGALLARLGGPENRARLCPGTFLGRAGWCLLLAVPLWWGRGVQRPNNFFGVQFTGRHVARGLHDCACFLRSQKPLTGTFLVADLDPDLVVGGLSEHPSFLSRVEMWMTASPAYQVSGYRAMLRQVDDLIKADTPERLRRAVAQTKIRWFLSRPEWPTAWASPMREQPVFESAGYKVYDFSAMQFPPEGSQGESPQRSRSP